MGMKKPISLRTAFWKFLIILITGLMVATIIPFVILLLGVTFGTVTYADYLEQATKNLAPIIATTPDLSEVDLPAGCKFLRLDKKYHIIETTLEDGDLEHAIEYATSGKLDGSVNKQYLLITRENEYVILQYYIGSQFINDWMNEHLPSPEELLYIGIGINCIIVCIFLTTRFSRSLEVQLNPLFEATLEVSKQNLDFEVGHSKIKEFEEVLISFADMKDNLKRSFKQQWKAEQVQKEQIAALAHDIKTPLTVIQGNADLINETDLDTDQKLYIKYIIESSGQMQSYIKTLIDISRATVGYQLNLKKINVHEYIHYIEMQIKSLCQSKKIHLQMNVSSLPQSMKIDIMLMERAIMNIVNNALDYSPKGGTLYIEIWTESNDLLLSITDEGTGFSKESLQHAQERFFMDDQSRSSRMHFGMGLYIADSIMKQHGGSLILENSIQTHGARVIMKIPYK